MSDRDRPMRWLMAVAGALMLAAPIGWLAYHYLR